MTVRPLHRNRGLRLLGAVLALGAAAGVTSALFAFAGTNAVHKKVPPKQASKATEAAVVKTAQAVTANRLEWDGVASKVVPLVPGDSATVVAGLSLPAGTYELKVAGSLWTTKGSGVQNIGCHLIVGKDSYGDSYVAVDQAGIDQAAYALVSVAKVTKPTSAAVACAVGKTPTESVSTQANIISTKLAG